MTKYFKTVFKVTVLTEDRPPGPDSDLEQVQRQITSGDWSGEVSVESVDELSPEEMAKALEDQGSDPDFFGLGSLIPPDDKMEEGDECPNCHNGTIEETDEEFRCRGECGSVFRKEPR
jgi:hypothetical protein